MHQMTPITGALAALVISSDLEIGRKLPSTSLEHKDGG